MGTQDESKHQVPTQEYLKDNVQLAVKLLKFQEFVGTETPTVTT